MSSISSERNHLKLPDHFTPLVFPFWTATVQEQQMSATKAIFVWNRFPKLLNPVQSKDYCPQLRTNHRILEQASSRLRHNEIKALCSPKLTKVSLAIHHLTQILTVNSTPSAGARTIQILLTKSNELSCQTNKQNSSSTSENWNATYRCKPQDTQLKESISGWTCPTTNLTNSQYENNAKLFQLKLATCSINKLRWEQKMPCHWRIQSQIKRTEI